MDGPSATSWSRPDETAAGSGGLSRESLVAALDATKVEKIGLLYSADYTAVPDQSTLTNALQIYQAKGGKFVLTRDLTPIPAAQ